MEFEEVLKGRRSIRRYKDEAVSMDDVRACLNAAMLAPTWKNSQTGRFYVTQGKALDNVLGSLPETNRAKVVNAPVLVVETFVKDVSGMGSDGQFANEGQNGWGWYDLGLATENFCLQAEALGLGTLIMGIRDEDTLRKVCGIGDDETVGAVIALGHPDIHPVMPKRKELEERVKFL